MLDLFKIFIFLSLNILFGCSNSFAQVDTNGQKCDLAPLSLVRELPSVKHALEMQVGFTRFEKYHSLSYLMNYKRWEVRAGLGYGIVKTLFQNRFFPQGIIGVSYDCLRDPRFNLGPTLFYSLSGYTYNRAAQAKVMYHDLFLGAQFFYGLKWSVGTRMAVGSSVEHLLDLPEGGRTWSPNYYGEIAVRYAF